MFAHLFVRHTCLRTELRTCFDEFLHGHIMKELPVIVTVFAIIRVQRTVLVLSENGIIRHRHRTTLTESVVADRTYHLYDDCVTGYLLVINFIICNVIEVIIMPRNRPRYRIKPMCEGNGNRISVKKFEPPPDEGGWERTVTPPS